MSIGEMGVLENGNLRISSSDHGPVTLTRWTIQPLSLDDLNSFRKNQSIEIRFTDLSVLEDASITEIKVTIQIPDLLESYCLVKGGWLPPGFGMLKRFVFADRNFISRIGNYFENNLAKKEALAGWFDDLRHFNMSIDLLPYAMEANMQQFPSKEEIKSQVQEAREKLKLAAPGVPITQYHEPVEDYAWRLLDHMRPSIEKRMAFLIDVAPHVKPCFATDKVLERWKNIATIAEKYDLKTDVVTLLALIGVSAPKKDSPGIGVLKITAPYLEKSAYNACLDIAIMEVFLNLQKKDPAGRYAIITKDAPLARFGGILSSLMYGKSENGILNITTSIPDDLIENKDPVLRAEFKRLLSGKA
ncbi:hypothetical protein ACU5P1_17725 [Pseudomonas plecoglossicida]|uniref:Uncharacterized protein n=1 Tax=Pseudomonas plecoglossicida TaxID=70775 RepID=A0AAD0VT39_PSEDL|nr:hypothetical protein [Pseudomonas plecoglossicida]AXM95742.1 hypothetical protein DVB73_08010 [Pseudomonas plecoglossicida]QLB56494.1 hypothetical protein HAV28_17550 [Pseudomonas plecoglossicida]GLR35839.1 hypothetical protein GCM10011247_12360 [Pseudomonas plecoglossicida]